MMREAKPHDYSDDAQCWCEPDDMVLCDECNAAYRDESCWKCEGRGLVKPREDDERVILRCHSDTPKDCRKPPDLGTSVGKGDDVYRDNRIFLCHILLYGNFE